MMNMKVLFGILTDNYTVGSMIWRDEDGLHELTLLSDGSVREKFLALDSMYEAKRRLFSSHYPCISAEVPDIRLAQKYLGKKSDLVELLPRAAITPEE